ncbi:hypothetical protein PTKIN_Ptkin12aG0080700 [Pterospermum kingtungense]
MATNGTSTLKVQRNLKGFTTVLKSAACECNHRSEISSLISSNIHGKLVDGHGFGNCGFQSTLFNQDLTLASQFTRLCLCCNKPWIARPNAQTSVPLKSTGVAVTKQNIPLSHLQNGLKKITDKFSAPAASHLGKTGFDPMSHVGYNELKLTCESDSEVPFSDNEDGNKEPNSNEPRDVRCLAPYLLSENDVCDHKEQLADQKTNPSVLPELISLDDIPPSSCVVEVPSFSASLLSDLISLVDTPSTVDVREVPLEASSEKLPGASEASKSEHISTNNNDEISKLISSTVVAGLSTDRFVDNITIVNSTDEDPSALHKLPVCGEEKSTYGYVTKQPMLTYNNGVSEDLNSLPAQNSSGKEIHLSLNNLSPRLGGHSIQLPSTTEPNFNEVQNLQNLVSMERSESASLESLDGSNLNEIEGENLVERLKLQVEYDQKCMNALHKELEEERSASAIAANQAMAMITRLQEEKAALHMEALQYLRTMEEQAEYDGDALDKANDLLAEKEKEIQDLEAELEYYRLNFLDERLIDTAPDKSINLKKEYDSVENTGTSSIKDDLKSPMKTMCPEASEVNDYPGFRSAWSEVEDEKLYISQRLKNLERKFNRLAHRGTSLSISDGEYFDEAANGGQHQLEFLKDNNKQVISQAEGNDLSVKRASSMYNGIAPSEEKLSTSISKDQVVTEANGHMVVSNGPKCFVDCRETGLTAIENEISDLNERLEALEADCTFIEHSLNSLQNGNAGLLFIQEILHQLRELRKLGITSRDVSIS